MWLPHLWVFTFFKGSPDWQDKISRLCLAHEALGDLLPTAALPLPLLSLPYCPTPPQEVHLSNPTWASQNMRWPWPPGFGAFNFFSWEFHLFFTWWVLSRALRFHSKAASSIKPSLVSPLYLLSVFYYAGVVWCGGCKLMLCNQTDEMHIMTLSPDGQTILRQSYISPDLRSLHTEEAIVIVLLPRVHWADWWRPCMSIPNTQSSRK